MMADFYFLHLLGTIGLIVYLCSGKVGIALEEDWLTRGLGLSSESLRWDHTVAPSGLGEAVARLKHLAAWRDWLCRQQGANVVWDSDRVCTFSFLVYAQFSKLYNLLIQCGNHPKVTHYCLKAKCILLTIM